MFFLERKKQKTFFPWSQGGGRTLGASPKSLFASFSTEKEVLPSLKPKHMIERETSPVVHQPMIPKQSAGRVPHDDVTARSGFRDGGGVEHLVREDERRAGAGDREGRFRDRRADA